MNNNVNRMKDCEHGHGLGVKGVYFKSSLPELETVLLIILWLKFSSQVPEEVSYETGALTH